MDSGSLTEGTRDSKASMTLQCIQSQSGMGNKSREWMLIDYLSDERLSTPMKG